MSARSIFTRALLTRLPDGILQIVKKLYYAHLIRSVTDDLELDLKLLRHLITPGEYVFDIGANIGVYTKFLSGWVGVDGRVYSVEPIPLTFEILCSNIRKLGLKNLEPINCAISDTNGFIAMEVPLWESGGENFYLARVVAENTENTLRRLKVESKTIDSLCARARHAVSFVKCDVEGHELNCVKGAIDTIRKSMPAWLIEISGDPVDQQSVAYETFELLTKHGYGVYWFDGKDVIKRRSGDKSVNYWFLAQEHVLKLYERGFTIIAS